MPPLTVENVSNYGLDFKLDLITPLSVKKRPTHRSNSSVGSTSTMFSEQSTESASTLFDSPEASPTGMKLQLTPPSPPLGSQEEKVTGDGRKVRKLPVPPAPQSAPPVPTFSQRTHRPLPSLPELHSQPVTPLLSVTPATPPPPASPPRRPSKDNLSPPVLKRPPRRDPLASLSLQTSADYLGVSQRLKRKSEAGGKVADSSSFLDPPSPTTVQKKRKSKLRRHFGERPPTVLISQANSDTSIQIHSAPLPLPKIKSSDRRGWLPPDAAKEIAQKLLLLNEEGEDSGEDSSDDETDLEDDSDDYTISVVKGVAYRTADVRRLTRRWSRRWILEDKGRKMEEIDFSEIQRALRALK